MEKIESIWEKKNTKTKLFFNKAEIRREDTEAIGKIKVQGFSGGAGSSQESYSKSLQCDLTLQ